MLQLFIRSYFFHNFIIRHNGGSSMLVKNIMEDIVNSTVDEILAKEKKAKDFENNKQDIIAYVLNRIPPKYVTSERGILHAELDFKFLFQQKTDMVMHIYDVLSLIEKRRSEEKHLSEDITSYNLYFPHLLGEVLEESSFSVIGDVKITLLLDGKPAEMMDSSWANPYTTKKSVNGYYHFWPVSPDSRYKSGDEVEFELLFEHPKFETYKQPIKILLYHNLKMNRTKNIPMVLLKLKEGEDSSFLYED